MGRVVVVGSINLDVTVKVSAFPRPGETTLGGAPSRGLGGKGANQAIAALRSGAETLLLGAVGDDAYGGEAIQQLEKAGLGISHILRRRGETGCAHILVSAGENQIVVSPGANMALSQDDVGGLCFERDDVCVVQLEIPATVSLKAVAMAKAAGALTILNPAPMLEGELEELLTLADGIVANQTEWAAMLGREFETEEFAALLGREARLHHAKFCVATLGGEGVIGVRGADQFRLPAHKVCAQDTTGAGDCFVGFLAGRLASGQAFEQALQTATTAAALSVQRPGAAASIPTLREVSALPRAR